MKIKINGAIISNEDKFIYDFFEMESTSPQDIESKLESANGQDVEIDINSGGGDVFAGSQIYTMIKEYKGNTTVKVMSIAGSAASVIAMAGDTRLISPTAQIMIHNVSVYGASGDHRDMQHTAEFLENFNKSIANSYILATNIEEKEILEMLFIV